MISGSVSFAFDPLQPDTRAEAQQRQLELKGDGDTAKYLHQVCTTMSCFHATHYLGIPLLIGIK